MELTYVVLKRIKVGGRFREAGEAVPEARSWRNVAAYISTGKIAPVPVDYTQSDTPPNPPDPPRRPDKDLVDMTADEVKAEVESGRVSADEAWMIESEGQQRKTLLSWLEKQQED